MRVQAASAVLVAAILVAGASTLVAAQSKTAPGRGQPAATGQRAPAGPARTDGAQAERSSSPIVIDADRMEASRKDGIVIFTGNVVAKQDNNVQTADRMEVYLDDRGERVLRIVSIGNVKIVTEDCRTGTARRAEYYDDEQRLRLIGSAKVWQEKNVVTGEEIEILLGAERSTVIGGPRERVKSIFYPTRSDAPGEEGRPGADKGGSRSAPCG